MSKVARRSMSKALSLFLSLSLPDADFSGRAEINLCQLTGLSLTSIAAHFDLVIRLEREIASRFGLRATGI